MKIIAERFGFCFPILISIYVGYFRVKGTVCPASTKVLPMCEYGSLSGKGIHLDTSSYSGVAGTCTCILKANGSGGSVNFDPVITDTSNCKTTLSVDSFSYLFVCNKSDSINGFVHLGTTVSLTLAGAGQHGMCLRISTLAAGMTLNVTCYQLQHLTATTTTTTTATPITTLPSQTPGQICDFTDYPVLSMCEFGKVSGKGVYLDTSYYNGTAGICTCTILGKGAAGSLNFNPVVVDKFSCQTTLSIDAFSYIHDCVSKGEGNGYLHIGSMVNVTLSGGIQVADCMKLYTDTQGMTIEVVCYDSSHVSTIQTPTPTPTPTPTTTDDSVGRVCPATSLPVLSMCTNQSVQAPKFFLDTSYFHDHFSQCTCTVRVVSLSGGTLEIYPYTLDNSNCDTRISVKSMSYYIACLSYAGGQKFLFPGDSVDIDIEGPRAAGMCGLVQTKAEEMMFQVNCTEGIIRTTTETPATTSTTTPEAISTTTALPTRATPTPTTTTPTPTTTITIPRKTTTTPGPVTTTTTTTAPATTEQIKTPTTTATTPTTTTVTTTSVPTVIVNSTQLVTENDAGNGKTDQQTFPVVGVASSVSAGVVFLAICITVILCLRKHQNEKQRKFKERLQLDFGGPNSVVINVKNLVLISKSRKA